MFKFLPVFVAMQAGLGRPQRHAFLECLDRVYWLVIFGIFYIDYQFLAPKITLSNLFSLNIIRIKK